MQQVARLVWDPLLPVDFCVQPLRYVVEQCTQTVSSIQEIFFNALFLIQNHSLIPPENEMTVMTLPQILAFRLRPCYEEHSLVVCQACLCGL